MKDFALTKGLAVALLAGVMSACFNLGLESGNEVLAKAKEAGASDLFALNPVILLVTLGGFCTNAVYCIFQNVKNGTGKDYFSVSGGTLLNNALFCALAGVLWYSQFFGLGMGKSYFSDSPVMLAFSWSILMSLNVIFSNVWGILLKEWKGTIWNINAGVSVQPERRSLNQKTGLHRADTTLHSVGFQPMLFISWQKKKNRITLNYYGNTWQPSLYDLISPTNNSDPLNITRSNPNLKPTYNQSVRLEAQNTKEGLFATLNWNNRINSQTRAVIYNQQTGGRETYPVNINGNWNISGVFRYQKRIKDFNLSANAGGSFAQDVNLINENQSEQPERSATHNTGLNSDLRLSYQPKWGNLDLNGRGNFQHSSNSLLETDTYTRNYTFGLNGFADLPGGIQLRTDANYSFRNGTNIKKGEDDQIVWNASITWRFLKKKQAEISANWVDILSQQKNYFRDTMADGLYENHTQQIGSYFIVSVKYRFNQPLHK